MLTRPLLALLSLLALGFFAFQASPAKACKCAPLSVTEGLSQADAVFEGRVVSIEDQADPNQPGITRKRVTLSIVRVWKDLEDVETVSVITNAESAACGFHFEPKQSYLVYATRNEQDLSVHSCSRTRPMADAAEDLAQLGAGVTPVRVAPTPAPAADTKKATDGTTKPPKTRGCTIAYGHDAGSALVAAWIALGLLFRARARSDDSRRGALTRS
ncbi:MAG: hypothetical protein QM778_19465 [Myxococcales bacterium]